MPDGFLALAFGFCAALVLDGGQDVVALGYQSEGECVVHAYFGESYGDTVTINGHEIGVALIDGGAEVFIDDLRFVIPKTSGI